MVDIKDPEGKNLMRKTFRERDRITRQTDPKEITSLI